MLMSTDRILVSHVGSLPRPPTTSAMLPRGGFGAAPVVRRTSRREGVAALQISGTCDLDHISAIAAGSNGRICQHLRILSQPRRIVFTY